LRNISQGFHSGKEYDAYGIMEEVNKTAPWCGQSQRYSRLVITEYFPSWNIRSQNV